MERREAVRAVGGFELFEEGLGIVDEFALAVLKREDFGESGEGVGLELFYETLTLR